MLDERRISQEREVHNLVNVKRRKHGLRPLYWYDTCAMNARESVRVCAERGFLFHSMRGGQFGENLAQGGWHFSSRAIVDSWLCSRKGHRENLLNAKATCAGVGIIKWNGKTFVSWVFSELKFKTKYQRRREQLMTMLLIFLPIIITIGVLFWFLWLAFMPR